MTALAQEKKMEMKQEMKHDKAMKAATCTPECGFMVKSHDENEVADMVVMHAKKAHKKEITANDAKKMIKSAADMEKTVEKTVKKEMEKKY